MKIKNLWLAFLLWDLFKPDIKIGYILMLELQPFFPDWKIPIANGQELLFIQMQLPFIVDRPFVFLSHS